MIEKKILALIPARGGSKRLPRKNVLLLGDKPLILWSILVALSERNIDTICVSTDNDEIASISKLAGAEVPFMRPDHLSSDTASSVSVARHALEYYKNEQGIEFEYILFLQPTSPLRNADDLKSSIQLLNEKNADAVISVCTMEHSPLWANVLPPDLSMDNFLRPELRSKRSQDLPTFYRLNGAIYLCSSERFLKEDSFFLKNNTYAYVMPPERSIDIDTLLDFEVATLLLKKCNDSR